MNERCWTLVTTVNIPADAQDIVKEFDNRRRP
jgi:hypothetical protein